MESNKKILLSTIGIAMLIVLASGVAFAFFNYTRTGVANNIRVGRIFFESKNEETISLNNLFPIDPSNTSDMNDPDKVGTYSIDIKGDTDYEGGVEYLVSTVNSNIYTSTGKTVPISLDVTVSSGLGTSNANYFTARESKNANIYKKLVGETLNGDERILVGFIKPNSTSGTVEGINGNITIKAYLDKNKILISDTYDGTESDNMGTPNSMAEGKTVLTTTEWNSLSTNGISFKVKVEANEGIWVEEIKTLYKIMQDAAVMDNIQSTYVSASSGINFGNISSDTNGKGVYERAGTENDLYPIYYYRGAVEDNNVVFGNFCWKAVRTTETGGVKLIYNGESQIVTSYEHRALISDSDMTYTNDSTYPYTFDGTVKEWTSTNHEDDATGTITFSVNEAGYYAINYKVSSEEDYDMTYFYKNDTLLGEYSGTTEGVVDLGQLTTTDVIKVEYTKDSGYADGNDNVIFSVEKQYGNQIQVAFCDNEGEEETQLVLNENDNFAFNTNYDSPAYAGYMYGDVYTFNTALATSGTYFGSSFTWDGTNYKLVDPIQTLNNTHQYTCDSVDAEGTCTTIKYFGEINAYINLTGGDGIEQAMTKMQTNSNNSTAKTLIDSWYASNLASYTSKLEDTIWCNDRSVGNNSGWYSSGGDLNDYLYYGPYQRSNWATESSTVKNKPNLTCINQNDRFTVNNPDGNGALTYPVAMITADEAVLAGGVAGIENNAYYLYNGYYYWSLSPAVVTDYANLLYIDMEGDLHTFEAGYMLAIRPSVSLKPGTPVISGTGTATDPYVIE